MSSQKPLSANKVASLLAELTGLDVFPLARAANIPTRNLHSWLGGRLDNLAVESVMDLLSLLGLRFEPTARLDSKRVHFWRLGSGFLGLGVGRSNPVSLLSKLFAGCQLVRLESRNRLLFWRPDFLLVVGDGVRVVIRCDRGFLGRRALHPTAFGLSGWRNDSPAPVRVRDRGLWVRLLERDLTPAEFDCLLDPAAVTWADLDLIARTHNLTAKQVAEWAARKADSKSAFEELIALKRAEWESSRAPQPVAEDKSPPPASAEAGGPRLRVQPQPSQSAPNLSLVVDIPRFLGERRRVA